MRTAALSIAFLALSWIQSAVGQPVARNLTGIFSTLRASDQSGDIVGMELLVLGGASGLSIVAQGSEGAPGVPVVFSAQVRGNEIQFEVPPGCPCGLPEGRYRGTVTSSGIALTGPGNKELFLPRGNSYWQAQ